jgi:DNA polymerase epsilon subunit 1
MSDTLRRLADQLLLNMYRWVCNPGSRCYCPDLQRRVSALMAKAFLQLVAEARRLGATIVHATLNRLVIATNKRHLAASAG